MNPILLDFPNEICSPRMTIRTPRLGDGPDVCEAINETLEQLKHWVPWATGKKTVDVIEQSVREAQSAFIARKDLRMHMYLKGTNTFVGGTGLHRIDWNVPRFEIGYWCRESFQGRGYTTEAVQRLEQFAFEQLNAKRVEIRIDPENTKSRKIPEKLGYHLEGCLRQNVRNPAGELRDTLVFAKIR